MVGVAYAECKPYILIVIMLNVVMLTVVAPISLTKTRALCGHFYSDDE
jgi:hypothetical protein